MNFLRRLFESKQTRTRRLEDEAAKAAAAARRQEEWNRHQERDRAISEAVDADNHEELRNFIREGSEINGILLKAIERQRFELCRWLITNGANPSDPRMLYHAAWGDGHSADENRIRLMTLLIEFGADVNALDPVEKMPPLYASAHGTIICTRRPFASSGTQPLLFLLDQGAEADKTLSRLENESREWQSKTAALIHEIKTRDPSIVLTALELDPGGEQARREQIIAFLSTEKRKRAGAGTGLRRVIVFKAGMRPSDERWYLQQVCDALGITKELDGIQIKALYVEDADLNREYIMGFALSSGWSVDQCTLTPFDDQDGGRGIVLKEFG